MDNFYIIGLVLCSTASVALLFAQRYVKSDLLWVLRLPIGAAFIVFAIFNAIHTHKKETQSTTRHQQIADVQLRLDNIKHHQASLKARAGALASEELKAWLDPEAQNDFVVRRAAVLHE